MVINCNTFASVFGSRNQLLSLGFVMWSLVVFHDKIFNSSLQAFVWYSSSSNLLNILFASDRF